MNKVEEFFKVNQDLRSIAFAARSKLLSAPYFPRATVYFRYDYEYFVTEGKEIVWIVIKTNLSYEEAYGRLDKFDLSWWVGVLPKTRGKLSIMVQAKEGY